MTYAELTRKRTYTTVEVEVDITDLAENGWHHEDDCPGNQPAKICADEQLREAIRNLHEQAHAQENPDPVLCRSEPCRSLTMDQIRGSR
jgi:hypothetical protein